MRQLTLTDIESTESRTDSQQLCAATTAEGTSCQQPAGENGFCFIPSHNPGGSNDNPMGRPSKFQDKRDTVLDAAAMGMGMGGIAEYAELDKTTLYDWLDNRIKFAWEFRLARPEPARRSRKASCSVDVVCEMCGRGFQTSGYRHRRNENNFCSPSCHKNWISENRIGENHPDYEGGRDRLSRGPGWRSVRQKALERDDYECQACGQTSDNHRQQYGCDLHVHHIEPRRSFDDLSEANDVDNLVTLCISCHGTYEGAMLSPVDRS